jgi:pimeloyl-ACP methyl ester carboxylesterase
MTTRSRGLARAATWIRDAAIISALTAVVYLAVCLVLGIALSESTLRMSVRPVPAAAMFRIRVQKQFGAQMQAVTLPASDGARLSAWYVAPPRPNGRSVILLHGIAGNRVDVSGYADIFLAKGYSVLLPDSRDHGESGGRLATFGLLERDDVRRWTEWVRGRAPGCTYLLGESMGAAVAVEATAVTPQLCAVAAEDSYADFREIAYERMGRETGLGTKFWRTAGKPIVESSIRWAHWRYHIWLPDAAPRAALAQSQVPALLMTGTNDHMIPMHHSEELAETCGERCALWVVPGAGHGGISTVAGAEFGRRILAFFETHDRAAMPLWTTAAEGKGEAPQGGKPAGIAARVALQ